LKTRVERGHRRFAERFLRFRLSKPRPASPRQGLGPAASQCDEEAFPAARAGGLWCSSIAFPLVPPANFRERQALIPV
jgi:hypothetical protein